MVFNGLSTKNNVDKVQYFVDKGADVNMRNDEPLLAAATNGRTRAMRILIKNGAKVNDTLKKRLDFWKRIRRKILVTNLIEKLGLM